MATSDGTQTSIESEITTEPKTLDTKKEETLASTEAQKLSGSQVSVESSAGANVEVSSPLADAEGSGVTLENATELMEKGTQALKGDDYVEAVDCFSRALEIRVGHYGELAPECSSAYYKYGCALLYKAQEETDPLGSVPKKEVNPPTTKHGGPATSAGPDAKKDEDLVQNNGEPKDGDNKKDQVEADGGDSDDDEASDGDDTAEPDEDESDLDLAWKMLDVARAIVEKNPEDTMEKVDILSALGEVALEREDIQTSYADYMRALSILERLVEPDSRHIAELNFRLCLVLELDSKPEEALPYCNKAISICKCRVQRLTEELKSSTVSTSVLDGKNQEADQLPGGSDTDTSFTSKEAEIKTLTDLSSELEKKLEDLQQHVLHPTSLLPEVLQMIAAKAAGNGKSASSSELNSSQKAVKFVDDAPIAFGTTTQSRVNDLGVVGRGVKRVSTSITEEQELSVVGRGVKRVVLTPISAETSAPKPLIEKDEASP